MKTLNLVQGAAVALATLGLMLPAPAVQAAAKDSQKITQIQTVNAAVLDISLQSEGQFAGRVVDHAGSPAANADVVIRQGSKEITRVSTDSSGRFEVDGLRGGVYEVASGKTVGTYRVWQNDVAPPAAKEQALLVLGENGTRGGFGSIGGGLMLLTAGVLASVIIGAIALDRINSVNDKVDKIPTSF